MSTCRACDRTDLHRVLDLGKVPAGDHFPTATEPVGPEESAHPLAMDLCTGCGLVQLAEDDTVADEPRGIEPQALRDRAADAVARVADAGWLRGMTVHEFGSPHGGTWVPLLTDRGFSEVASEPASRPADVVLDSFGIMHDPDQRAAFELRAAATDPDGVLLLQFHSLLTIVSQGQWNALRHGHFAYYSLIGVDRPAGRGRHERGLCLGVRPVRRNRAGRRRTRPRRARRTHRGYPAARAGVRHHDSADRAASAARRPGPRRAAA
jgi:Putative zinc binding domain